MVIPFQPMSDTVRMLWVGRAFSTQREHTRLRGYAFKQMIFRELEVGDRLRTSHRGKPFKKLVQSGIFLQMIEQCLDGDPGASKAWDTAKDFRVDEDGSGQSGRIHKLNLRSMGGRSSGVETGSWRAPTGSGQVRGRRVGVDFEF